MDAKITLTATPREFDLLRKAVEDQLSEMLALTHSTSTADPSVKRAAHQSAAELTDLLTKLK